MPRSAQIFLTRFLPNLSMAGNDGSMPVSWIQIDRMTSTFANELATMTKNVGE